MSRGLSDPLVAARTLTTPLGREVVVCISLHIPQPVCDGIRPVESSGAAIPRMMTDLKIRTPRSRATMANDQSCFGGAFGCKGACSRELDIVVKLFLFHARIPPSTQVVTDEHDYVTVYFSVPATEAINDHIPHTSLMARKRGS